MVSLKLSSVSTNSIISVLPVKGQYWRKNEEPLSSSLKLLSSNITGEERHRISLQCVSNASAASSVVSGLRMPKHMAVIMDGCGRWARNRGQPTEFGHNAAMVTLKNLVIYSCEFEIKVLTVFVFSTENWSRSQVEVDFFMRFIESFIRLDVGYLSTRHNIRFSVIVDKSRLPEYVQSAISSAEEASHGNKGMHFLLALSYGGRHEIAEACKKIATDVKEGVLGVEDIDESLLDQKMMTNITAFPNPDLMIRPSGELRVSNFLLWQLAYTEFYFPDKLFPDLERTDFIEALNSFQLRNRRFGGRPT